MAAIRAKEKGIAMHYKMTSGDVARSPLKFGERPEPDDEKKLNVEPDEEPDEKSDFGAGLEGMDETGRNMASFLNLIPRI